MAKLAVVLVLYCREKENFGETYHLVHDKPLSQAHHLR